MKEIKMAASLARRVISMTFKNSCTVWNKLVRRKSRAHIVMSDDSSTIVCWHPETYFPYEKSLPIPEKVIKESDSVLKIQTSKEFLEMLKPKSEELVVDELRRITFTTKHIWYPKSRFFYRRKKVAERDRPYL